MQQFDSLTAEQILARVRERLTKHNAQYADLPVRLSLGVATAEKDTLMQALKVADQQMYEDKHARKSKQ